MTNDEYDLIDDENKKRQMFDSLEEEPATIAPIEVSPSPIVAQVDNKLPPMSQIPSSTSSIPQEKNLDVNYLKSLLSDYSNLPAIKEAKKKAEEASNLRRNIDLVSGLGESARQIGHAIAGVQYKEPEAPSMMQKSALQEEEAAGKQLQEARKLVALQSHAAEKQQQLETQKQIAEMRQKSALEAKEQDVLGGKLAREFFEANKEELIKAGITSPDKDSLKGMKTRLENSRKAWEVGSSYAKNQAEQQKRAQAFADKQEKEKREYKATHQDLPNEISKQLKDYEVTSSNIKDGILLAEEINKAGEVVIGGKKFGASLQDLSNAVKSFGGSAESLSPSQKAYISLGQILGAGFADKLRQLSGTAASDKERKEIQEIIPTLDSVTSFPVLIQKLKTINNLTSKSYKKNIDYYGRRKRYDMTGIFNKDGAEESERYPGLYHNPEDLPSYTELRTYNESKFSKNAKKVPISTQPATKTPPIIIPQNTVQPQKSKIQFTPL